MIFDCFKRRKNRTKADVKVGVKVGDTRAITNSPFPETLTVAFVREVKDGWVLYSFCDYVNGEHRPRDSHYSDEYNEMASTFSNLLSRNGEVIDVRGDLIDKEQIQRVIDDSMPDGINGAFGVARAARVREEQRQMNASMTGLIDNISKTKDFNEWFDNYSFKYIPSFAKPLIKQWVKAAYFAALGEVK